ncbi:bifunctional 2-polyprenyl-6-hydroxyphenol methylase/3-demethylubiquinol 3-O-methyltransferase UbiG [Desulfovibrio sp. X2]|uniref:class I SAM-dependent methyltransferase n=1 Tax=Desulfovibrio sp. X2 TaxID=941449 RepID=UPI00040FE81C|nr:methyltransferase domain-containing protein [Desulfovibrio sp. X2]
MKEDSLRVNPGMDNYFIGDQYKCQPICITEGFWTDWRIKGEVENGSRPVLEWAMTQLDLGAPLSILDLGCGPSQKMAEFFGQRKNVKVTGLDSEEATALARGFNPGGTYYACDLDSDEEIARVSPLLEDTFDVIFALDVIEHVLHPEKMLDLMKAHSTPATKIFITTLERDLSAGAGDLQHGSVKAEHVREWNTWEFTQFIKGMGFTVKDVKLTPMGPDENLQTLVCSYDPD